MRTVVSVPIVLLLLLLSCAPDTKVQMNKAEARKTLSQTQLDPRIPPPDPSRYKYNIAGKDWPNPSLLIRREDIQLTVKAASIENKIVSLDELASVLTALPPSAWPYGKVVAVGQPGLRGQDNDRLIEENRAKTESVLNSLGVTIDWRPIT
ncbi:MAG TPA: hypothetical protein VE056_00815 [Pyrinomonadaceae bacterium]|nr:hypothetical protein [Pyrinomonadaceae bacterium]